MPLTLTEDTFRQYRDLAAKLAWKFWKALPPSCKTWIDPEDLVAHAYLCMAEKFHKYNLDKSMKSTFFWYVLSNELQNYVRAKRMQKRTGEVVCIDAIAEPGRPDALLKQREALYSLAQIYSEATPECRKQMRRWFGQMSYVTPRKTPQEKRVMKEFRQMATKYRLTPDDCRELMRGGVCLP